MGYCCVVCIKYVPDTKRVSGEAMKEDGTVNRAALPMIFNPEDRSALEEALAIRDAHEGTVTVVTMGPPAAADILREALCCGADRVILITDLRAVASDTLATSYILAHAVRQLQPDIVLCGRQAIDGDTAQVGPQLAEKLGVPAITYLEQLVALEDRAITVRRNVGNGWEVVRCPLPALVTVTGSANTPRPPAARRMMKFKKARTAGELEKAISDEMPDASEEQKAAEVRRRCQALKDKGLLIEQVDLDSLKADLTWCGRSGSPTKVQRIQWVVLSGGEYQEYKPTDEGIRSLVGQLLEDHTIG